MADDPYTESLRGLLSGQGDAPAGVEDFIRRQQEIRAGQDALANFDPDPFPDPFTTPTPEPPAPNQLGDSLAPPPDDSSDVDALDPTRS